MARLISLPHHRDGGIRSEHTGSVDGGTDAGRRGRQRTRLGISRELSWALGLRGGLALLLGLLALLWPGVTVSALALLFGAYAAVDGVAMMAGGLAGHAPRRRRWGYAVAGLAGLVAGLSSLLWPQITALALVSLAGAWALVTGVLEVVAVVRLRRVTTGEWLLAAAGVISVVAGVLILLRPASGAPALATVLGVYAVIAGVVLLAAAWYLRKEPVVIVEV
ncbi:HdeD family acid-resistance protein [Geodermatophilus sp. DSM 44513]|uniref:HdeD family acid-resistance protein n=1 Tax=Geodermatophilus sp. DSM 44513 TaxID=1528104 RepID=UPI0012891653|nr:DUF308 domain-containing protein [Geodermatophilus sp. DSM 44513]WNV75234.1 DUF308 domain-containing protein [Geodermatophilus sp. DSM 44513]